MTNDSKRLMWRMPICILIGIALSLGLSALNLAPGLFVTLFIVIAVVLAFVGVYVEEQIVIRTGIRPGMRVRINVGSLKDKEGIVISKKPFGTTLPLRVAVDDVPDSVLFAQDELTQIKE